MKNKIYIFLVLTTLVSCTKTEKIEDILIANPNEYWAYYNPNSTDPSYFKFESNNLSERYERNNENKFYKYKGEGDVVEGSRKWGVSNDSILKFNGLAYDIVSCNNEVIVLYYRGSDGRNERMVFLTKEKEGIPRRYAGFFGQKRMDQPSKYVIPNGW